MRQVFQLNQVARDYYSDQDFGRPAGGGELSLWQLFNLLTAANKSSYIDLLLPRAANASNFVGGWLLPWNIVRAIGS